MSKIQILDASLAPLATVDGVFSAARSERINGENTLSFATTIHDGVTALIGAETVFKLGNDYFDVAYYKREQQRGAELTISVEAEHVSYRLNNPDYDVEFFTETGTPATILGKILAGTGFTVGTVEFSGETTFSLQEKASRRGLLMQFVAYLQGEALFEGFEISILEHRGSSEPVDLVAGKNIEVLSTALDKRTRNSVGNPTVSYSCGLIRPVPLALGDEVYLKNTALDIDVTLRIVTITTNPYRSWEVTVEVGNYVNSLEDELYRIETEAVRKDAMMNGCRIGPQYGFEAVRNDKKARAYFKSDAFAIQTGDGSGSSWTDKLYFAVDPDTGQLEAYFGGKLTAEVIAALSAVITPNLYAEKATIAELTVDQLDTSVKVKRYLDEDTADVNYIRISEQTAQWITAQTDGLTTEQAEDRNGSPLYWTDETHTASTTDETDYPVTIYQYTDYVKGEISFFNDGTNYIPRIVLGTGTGVDDNDKLIIIKETSKATIEYTTAGGNRMAVEMSADGMRVKGNTVANGIRNVYYGAEPPESPEFGDMWFDTSAV